MLHDAAWCWDDRMADDVRRDMKGDGMGGTYDAQAHKGCLLWWDLYVI